MKFRKNGQFGSAHQFLSGNLCGRLVGEEFGSNSSCLVIDSRLGATLVPNGELGWLFGKLCTPLVFVEEESGWALVF